MKNLFKKLSGAEREEAQERLERRLNTLERRQIATLHLLQKQMYAGTSLIDPNFNPYGAALFSMHNEDGLLLHIFKQIGAEQRTFFEIGIQDGMECNTANLSQCLGWTGVLIEGSPEYAKTAQENYSHLPGVTIKQSFVTKENINSLAEETKVDQNADLFSLDIDGNDYWIWETLKPEFRPRLVVVEYNLIFGAERAVTIPYDPTFVHRQKHPRYYHGASLAAFVKLGRKRGYKLIGVTPAGQNAFFLRDDITKGGLEEVNAADVFPSFGLSPRHQKKAEEALKLPVVEV